MFGFSVEKFFLILVVAAFIIGPQRLPAYAAQLAKFVKTLRSMANNAKDRMNDEFGTEFQDVDWKKLDPRQYDPRRIIRTALLDDEPTPVVTPVKVGVVTKTAADGDSVSEPSEPARVSPDRAGRSSSRVEDATLADRLALADTGSTDS